MNKIIQKFGWTGSLLILIILISIVTSVLIKQIRQDSSNQVQVKEENNEIKDEKASSIKKQENEKLNKEIDNDISKNEKNISNEVKVDEVEQFKQFEESNKKINKVEKSKQDSETNIERTEVEKLKQDNQVNVENNSKVENEFNSNLTNSKSQRSSNKTILKKQNEFQNEIKKIDNEKNKKNAVNLEKKSENNSILEQKKPDFFQDSNKNNFVDDGYTNKTIVKKKSPKIDVFRVDKTGNYLIAGKTLPNSEVIILSNENEIGKSVSDSDGNFVIIGKLTQDTNPKEITIKSSKTSNSNVNLKSSWLLSDDTFVVLPNESNVIPDNEAEFSFEPIILKSNEKNTEIIQKSEGGNVNQVTLDLISYNEIGDVILSGRGRINNNVFIYLNKKFIIYESVTASGGWKTVISDIKPGIYNLRIDEVDYNGNVKSRISLPFKRESIKLLTNLVSGTITVQSGNSLWRIARRILGGGIRYTEIYEKNKNLIKNPDLIYPGQVFEIPN